MKHEMQGMDVVGIDRLLHALADPVRRGIYRQIVADPGIACAALGPALPRSTVSVHLKTLREAELIAQERNGQLILNRAREDGAAAAFPDVVRSIMATG